MSTPSIQTLITQAQQVLNLKSSNEIRATLAAVLANANVGTPLNPNLTTQQLWDEFYEIVRQPSDDIMSIITDQMMRMVFSPPAPGGAGADKQVIFNDGGVLAGDAGLVYNKTTDALTVAGLVTAGSATITGDLTVDTSTLKVDSTNNRVGIGTASPAVQLHVNAGNGNQLVLSNAGEQFTLIEYRNSTTGKVQQYWDNTNSIFENYLTSTGAFTWKQTATEFMRLNSTGLGIGGAPISGFRLNVNNGDFRVSDTQNEDGVELGWSSGGSYGFVQAYNRTTSAFKDLVLNSAVTINSSGNVGIGVTPSVKLDVLSAAAEGTIRLTSTIDGSNASPKASSLSLRSGTSSVETARIASFNRFANVGGGDLVFSTADTSAVLQTRATIDSSGNLLVASGVVRAAGRTEIGSGYIGDISGTGNNTGIFFGSLGLLPANGSGNSSDNTYDLGSATYRWDTVFAGTGTINTSDRNEKQDISDLSASEKRVASSIKQLVKKYRFKDAVASKGENARLHVGWIAQDIQSAFAAEGLDASDYGMFCSDTWEENGVEKTRLGLRYDEVLAFVVSTI